MYYKILLYLLPLPLIVFLWNSGLVDIGNDAKVLFSLILVFLTVGGFIDLYQNDYRDGVEDDE